MNGVEKLRPGLARHCKERAILSRALGGYRTPSNHHLRRALRLSWVRAASAVVDHSAGWAARHEDQPGAREITKFVAMFDAARNDVIRVACNNDSGAEIGESPIDGFLDAVLDDLGKHLMDGQSGTGRETIRASLAPTLVDLIGCHNDEIPQRILSAAYEGFSINEGERRDFGQLLFDEFARVVQTPNFYPEAGVSFQLALSEIHHRSNEDFQTSLRNELSNMAITLPAEIRGQVEEVISEVSFEWLQETLATNHTQIMGTLSGIRDDIGNLRANLAISLPDKGIETVRAIDQHTPVQSRTVMFAGFRNRPHIAAMMDDIADIISRKTSRRQGDDAIVPLMWDFVDSLAHEAPDGEYAQYKAWSTLDENVVGGVLVLSEAAEKDIDPNLDFVVAAQERNWLEPDGPLHDLMDKRAKDRLDALQNQAVPITYETRFALECVLRGKPLLVIAPRHRDDFKLPVRNFMTFITEIGVPCLVPTGTEAETLELDSFTKSLIVDDPVTLMNPYRGLDYYQISDADSYQGRKPEAAQALAYIKEALDEERGLFLGVTGPSGCGKSSFLRARVAAGAKAAHGLKSIEIRPTDFRIPGDTKIRTLPHLCEEIAARLDATPLDELVGENAIFHKAHVPKFKAWLDKALAKNEGENLLICLDQFEEVLDDLSEDVHGGEWRSLFDILTHLVSKHRWSVVMTIEDSRLERFDRLAEELGLRNTKLIKLPDKDDDFYRSVICKPFESVGIDLHDDIVETLLEELERHRTDVGSSSSPLPLLSLRLEALFREVSPKAPATPDKPKLSRNFERVVIRRNDLRDPSLAIGTMVADLAATAWRLGGGGEKPADIGHFLRPLIRVSIDQKSPDDAKLVLQTVAGRGMPAERQLEAEFKRRRVLVPSGGGLRLVHESVIRRWPEASKWFDREREQLLRESAFRADAIRWADLNRPAEIDANVEQIATAARLLSAHSREWALRDLPPMDAETAVLREYAIAIFVNSHTPRELNNPDDPNTSHIHLASSYGLDTLLEKFLETDPDAIDLEAHQDKNTPLSNACWSHTSTVKLLLERGAKPDHVDGTGFGPVDRAVWGECDDIIDVLLKNLKPGAWDKNRMNPLCGAAARGRLDLARKLSSAGFRHNQPSREGWTPLHAAATQKSLSVFKYFLERGDLNSRWQRLGPAPTKKLKKDKDEAPKDVYIVSRTPFHVAASYGHTDIVRYLLSMEVAFDILEAPTETGETPLINASRSHMYHTVSVLLNAMTDPNARTTTPWGEGYMALHHALADYDTQSAAAAGHIKRLSRETAKVLLTCENLDVLAKTENGMTAWQMAIGLPDVQRAIAAHPKFTDEAMEKIRKQLRSRNLSVRQGELIDAVINDNHEMFDATLDYFVAEENLDGSKKIGDSTKHLGNLLLEKGWSETLERLIKRGFLDPWRDEKNYVGLLGDAHKYKAKGVIALIMERMPKAVPTPILESLLIDLRSDRPVIYDPEGTLQTALIEDSDTDQLKVILFLAARLGEVDLYRTAVAKGADETALDDWGRTARDTGSISLQKALDFAPTSTIADAPDLFYPFADGWTPLDDKSIAAKIKPVTHLKWDDTVDLKTRTLPFYQNTRLIIAKHNNWKNPNQYLYWLEHDGDLYRLNGTSPPIHELNAKKTLDLAGGKALDYLKFFCFFVRGEEGPFYVIDNMSSHYLPSCVTETSNNENIPATFQQLFCGSQLFGLTDDGAHRVSSLVYYSNAVFRADFLVQPSGMIEMQDDWPLLKDLPDRIDAPLD